MLHKTRGIVIKYIKYRDTSVIVRIYTEEFGLHAYIINGIRSKSSKKSLALLQPLSLLDLVVYKKKNQNGGISRLSEYQSAYPFRSIPFDIKKSTMALFICEWLSKILTEDAPDHSGKFPFLFESIKSLDALDVGYQNFHLQLMIKMASFLGFGIWKPDNLLSKESIGHEQMNLAAEYALKLQRNDYLFDIKMSSDTRRTMLDLLIGHYQTHIDSFGDIKSTAVLKDVFHP